MIKMGMVIGDRYEVLEKIGTGGMSDVYRAKDIKLSRMVAVKILKQEFSENENFVRKFRTEAQSAAGLMHPNIVNVYDVGDEKGIYYIVMELVDGITLKRYIEEKQRLTVKEAVSISIQVAMGLEAAHNHNIIHRDIKPQNIIISKEGKVKVTDFGIAKAATSNTITSNVMGSVHYTSPEQARGGYSDAKSDIYSLGVTMFEMLTGRVPFNGDTTVAIAIKHIQEPIQPAGNFAPDIPISVEKIVLKCCQKSADRRYQTVSELISDLKQSLITPDEDFVKLLDPDTERSTRIASDDEVRQIKREFDGASRLGSGAASTKKSHSQSKQSERGEEKKSSNRGYSSKTSTSRKKPSSKKEPVKSRKKDEDDDFDSALRGSHKIEKFTMVAAIVIGLLVVVILVIAIGSAYGIFSAGSGAKSAASSSTAATSGGPANAGQNVSGVEVPSLSDGNMLYAEARSRLESIGFMVTKIDDDTADAPQNTVVDQYPSGGSYAALGSEIVVYVSTGEGYTADSSNSASSSTTLKIDVPDVKGLDLAAAQAALIYSGFKSGKVTEENSDSPVGTVINQSPAAGEKAAPDTEVNLVQSKGPTSYSFNASIAAPTEAEIAAVAANVGKDAASIYKYGSTNVHIQVYASIDGYIYDNYSVNFPISVNVSGLQSSTGSINLSFAGADGSTYNIQRNVEFTH